MVDKEEISVIGRTFPRKNARTLVGGHGKYIEDINLPRMVHIAFVRSPHAHARIIDINSNKAKTLEGVVGVITGNEMSKICLPWQGIADHLPALRSPYQHPLAIDRVAWQGEPVALVAAETRAQAEDAAQAVIVDWEPAPAVSNLETALDPDSPLAHPEYDSNLAFEQHLEKGKGLVALDKAALVIERTLYFSRQTGVTLEPRGLIADFRGETKSLTLHASHQSPWQQKDVIACQFGLDEHEIRIITPDVGGGFGLKLQVYGDEMATVAASIMLNRPVKYIVDRLEAFISDTHAREMSVTARMGLTEDGLIKGLSLDATGTVGAYSSHRRIGIADGAMTIRNAGAPYRIDNYDARLRIAFQNKPSSGVYRGVGQPIACAVTEQLIDIGARQMKVDPIEIRRKNYLSLDEFPCPTPGGAMMTPLSLDACLESLFKLMEYDKKREEQVRQRANGKLYGIGIATVVEFTAVGPAIYGPAGARLTTQDGCTVRLEPSGKVVCITSVTEQGQGTWTGLSQIVADQLGINPDEVRVVAGDTAVTPYGGGAWASRGLTIGGEAALKASNALRENILTLAAAILQTDPSQLTLKGGIVSDIEEKGGQTRISLSELSEIGHFRQDTLPQGIQPELAVTRHYFPDQNAAAVGNGMVGATVHIDEDTGFTSIDGLWMVDDCGRVVNPLLVDEQVRGGLIQGVGAALWEECLYDPDGQLMNGTMADYLVPMCSELPDISVAHVETPLKGTELGTKGVGEVGTVGGPAAILLAVNDALHSVDAHVDRMPMTPEVVLDALNKRQKQ